MTLTLGATAGRVLVLLIARKARAKPAAEVSEVFDEPPGGTVGVEVLVIGEPGQLIEDAVRGVQQPVFEDLSEAEEFSQVLGLVLGEGDRFGGHGGLRFRAGWNGPAAQRCGPGLNRCQGAGLTEMWPGRDPGPGGPPRWTGLLAC